MPLHEIGQHAQKQVGLHTVLQAMVDGPHLQIHALEAAEGPLLISRNSESRRRRSTALPKEPVLPINSDLF